MAQRQPEEKITVDQVLKLVNKLSPEEQGTLRHKLDASWSAEWKTLINEVDEHNIGSQALSEKEIAEEVEAARQDLKTDRAHQSNR